MSIVPSSPRKRRRLARASCALILVAGIAVAAMLVPRGRSAKTAEPVPVADEPAQTVAEQQEVRLTAADRRAINRTLDRFVVTAVTRKNPGAAWALAGPTLRADTTRADWAKGDVPVFPFPAKGARFHGWKPSLAYRDDVLFDVLLHPTAKSKEGPVSFTVEMKRRGGRWLVDGFVPVAEFSRSGDSPTVLSQADYAPGVYSPHSSKRHINKLVVAVPFVLLGLILLVPLTLGLLSWYRGRRAFAEHQAFVARHEALRRSAAH